MNATLWHHSWWLRGRGRRVLKLDRLFISNKVRGEPVAAGSLFTSVRGFVACTLAFERDHGRRAFWGRLTGGAYPDSMLLSFYLYTCVVQCWPAHAAVRRWHCAGSSAITGCAAAVGCLAALVIVHQYHGSLSMPGRQVGHLDRIRRIS